MSGTWFFGQLADHQWPDETNSPRRLSGGISSTLFIIIDECPELMDIKGTRVGAHGEGSSVGKHLRIGGIDVRSCSHIPVGDDGPCADGEVVNAVSIQSLEDS